MYIKGVYFGTSPYRCNPIEVSKDQAEALFRKHMVSLASIETKTIGFLFWKQKVTSLVGGGSLIIESKYDYDDEDNIGFVTLYSKTGKKISYQMTRNQTEPCFVEVGYFESIRYDINYPDKIHPEMYEFLKEEGIKARDNFWKGTQI